MTRVAVLRPEPGNAATAARIAAAGWEAVRLPLFAVRPLAWSIPAGEFDTLVLTSANAIRHGGAGLAALRHLPVVAVGAAPAPAGGAAGVGAATATAARAAGFDVIHDGAGGVADLPRLGRPLHLAGREHRAVSGATTVPVYASEPVAVAASRLAGTIALVHSARAAARLAALVDPARVALVAISAAAREAAGPGWRAAAIAAVPTDDAMIAAAATLIDADGAPADNPRQ